MQVQWRKLIFKTAMWLAAEIVLSLLGLDNLADYSEFLQQDPLAQTPAITMTYSVVDR